MFPWPKLVTIHSGSCQNLEKTFHLATFDPLGGWGGGGKKKET